MIQKKETFSNIKDIKDKLLKKNKNQNLQERLKTQGFDLKIQEIGEDIFLSEKEGYILGFDDKYRKILSVSPINSDFLEDFDLSKVKDKLSAVFNRLERFQITIQKETVDYRHFIQNLTEVEKKQNNIITQTKQHNLIKYVENAGKKLNHKNMFYLTLEDKSLDNLNNNIRSIRKLMDETHLTTDVLTKKEILILLKKRLCPEQCKISSQPAKTLDDILPPNAIDYKGLYQIIDNEYQRQLVISFYPENVPEFLWLKPLFKLDESINISIISKRKSSSQIVVQIDRNIMSNKVRLHDIKKESEIRATENEIKSSQNILSEISSQNSAVFDTALIINIHAETEEDLRNKTERVQTVISSLSLRYIELLRKEFLPFFSTLPILPNNRITENYTWNLLSSDIASLIIFDDSEFFHENGIPVGKNPDTGSLYAFNPFSGRDFYNPHVLIIGFTGSGKTFFIQYLCERLDAYTDYTIKLDIAGTLTTPNSKRYIFATDGNLTVNPFFIRSLASSRADKEDNPNPVTEKTLDLLSFFQAIADFNQYQMTILESLIRNTFEACKITDEYTANDATEPTFSKFNEILELKKKYLKYKISETTDETEQYSYKKEYMSLEDISAYIKPYVFGAYSKLFNGINNYEYEKNTVLDFSKLSDVLKKPLYNLVLKDLWRFCIKDGSNEKNNNVPKKVIVVDEEHEFTDREETLKMISAKLIKQGRKYNTMVINATQDMADLEQNHYAQAILSNCNFKFLFKLGTKDNKKVQDYYNLTEKEMRLIRGNKLSAGKGSAEKGKGILIIDCLHVPFKSEATLEEIKIIDPALYKKLVNDEVIS